MCTDVSPAKAEEKQMVTSQVFEGFKREQDAYLKFGGKMGEPFARENHEVVPGLLEEREPTAESAQSVHQ